MLIETVGVVVGNAVITRLSGDASIKLFSGRQDREAMKNAFAAAWSSILDKHRSVLTGYDVNESFWAHEGADEIARILLPGPGPDPRNLARACVYSLGGDRHAVSSDPLVGPFEDFIDDLTGELGRNDRFRTQLNEVASTRPDRPGPADESEFLEWVVRRFEFLQTAGIGTAQHLQLPLREVFVEPQGVLERHGGVKWSTRGEELRALLEDRRRNREISPEEYETELDRLTIEEGLGATAQEEKVAVAEVVRQSERVVVLGDPGTGKTTLLRYLALRHAQALLDREATVSPALGEARMPLYIRAGDFARSQQRDAGVRAFIVPFLAMTLQCPVKAEHLEGLIDRRLRAGRALVLIDGLDEVTTAQDRAIVVENISNFVGAQQPRGNRFICTSRISGYPAAPLPPEFQAVRLLEMTDASIEQFLNQYVPAIEHAEATKKSIAIAHQDAKRTIQELLNAFDASPGVRRLATNPLLLTALLLVHRTHGALPERRVDAYKAVTDALGHTWRVKQGVPELELPDERRLTQWLTRLADWMHAHRPEGSATVRDLLDQWGPLWARLQREPWNQDVLDAADPAATDAGSAILAFVAQVEQHTGLLGVRGGLVQKTGLSAWR